MTTIGSGALSGGGHHPSTHPSNQPSSRQGAHPDAHGAALFVHDFVAVDRPIDEVLDHLGYQLRLDHLADLIVSSWRANTESVHRAGVVSAIPAVPAAVLVETGPPRFRAEAVILPVRWHTNPPGWLPNVEADLEVAPFGSRRTHIHLLGRYELPAGLSRLSTDASLVQRLAVALVRQVLLALAESEGP